MNGNCKRLTLQYSFGSGALNFLAFVAPSAVACIMVKPTGMLLSSDENMLVCNAKRESWIGPGASRCPRFPAAAHNTLIPHRT